MDEMGKNWEDNKADKTSNNKAGNRKAVSEIISVILITLIGIALVGTAYTWGLPLISKQQDSIKAERLYNYFNRENSNSIVRKIEFVAKNGGQETFASDIDGTWTIHEYSEQGGAANSLEFVTFSKVSNIAISSPATGIDWVALTPGGSCPPTVGIVGLDPSYVVCAKAEPFSDGFTIKYRVWFREIYESTATKGYKINITKNPSGQISSVGKNVMISRGSVSTCQPQQCGKTLIMTEIKILLV
jgi:FlaG/FlaF family flagellin (archaellin)